MNCEKCVEDIATLKADVNMLKEKTDDLSSINKSLERLSTTIEFLREDSKDTKQTLKELSDTNTKNTEALDRLNAKIDKTDEKLETLNKKVDETQKRGSFNWIDMVTTKIIPIILGSGILFFIVQAIDKIK
jgi:SMC interacting uncharacterized protein involved in chromosome segregation